MVRELILSILYVITYNNAILYVITYNNERDN
jgi:hypothetical protein